MNIDIILNSSIKQVKSWAAIVHLNCRAGSTFPVRVFTVSPGHWVNNAIGMAGATRLTWSHFRLNLLLLKGRRCVKCQTNNKSVTCKEIKTFLFCH